MTELEGTILFWEATLKRARFLLEPSVELHITHTIEALKQLQPPLCEQNSREVPTLPQNG